MGFELVSGEGRSLRLDWEVTISLARVFRTGVRVGKKKVKRALVGTLRAGRAVPFRFDLPNEPSVYRFSAAFRSSSGEKLGSFAFYVAVQKVVYGAIFNLDDDYYYPGETVFARVENRGTTTVLFGTDYLIERFERGTWSPAPETPTQFTDLRLARAPGTRSGCFRFSIPQAMPGGSYRISKQARFVSPFPGAGTVARRLFHKFNVASPQAAGVSTAAGPRTTRRGS